MIQIAVTDGVIQIQVEVDVEHAPLEIKEKEKQEIKMYAICEELKYTNK